MLCADRPSADFAPELWINPDLLPARTALGASDISIEDVIAAESRLARFAPLLSELFDEVRAAGGLIESDLLAVPGPAADRLLALPAGKDDWGRLFVKADHDLPVAGSIKARGGIYEVLEFAEGLALQHGLLASGGSYAALAAKPARDVFSRYTIAVGSTGNLGVSIGIMAAALGFRATVHMSAEAKQWKKQKLREHGVEVVEYAGDYAAAVETGRRRALEDPLAHFVDDERSKSLFLGYSVAALRLREQLRRLNIAVDAAHPLFVYLPCGVGGAPAGITFGLKQVFGDDAHCWFVEPTAAACFLTRMKHPEQPGISVYDLGMDNVTEADGLAVPVASELAYAQMRNLVSGIATVTDDAMLADLAALWDVLRLKVEPSAAAALSGARGLLSHEMGNACRRADGMPAGVERATHILWSTGGRFIPQEEFQNFLARGRQLESARG